MKHFWGQRSKIVGMMSLGIRHLQGFNCNACLPVQNH